MLWREAGRSTSIARLFGSPRATPLAPRRLAAVLRGSDPSILDLFLPLSSSPDPIFPGQERGCGSVDELEESDLVTLDNIDDTRPPNLH